MSEKAMEPERITARQIEANSSCDHASHENALVVWWIRIFPGQSL